MSSILVTVTITFVLFTSIYIVLKAPKIQRLVTPVVLQRRRHRLALKKKRLAKRKSSEAEYAKLLAQRKKESKVGFKIS